MSENYKLYVEKTAKQRAARITSHPLRKQLEELLELVRQCEFMWALEDRIERSS